MAQEKRNVVLVRLKNPVLGIITPPLGIGYLLKALKAVEGVNPVFIDCHLHNIGEKELIQQARELDPLLFGVQVFSVDYSPFTKILPSLKKALPDTVFVAGGPHVTALPEETLAANTALDYVVCGEGETALPMVVRGLLNENINSRLPDIPNLAYRQNGKYARNETRWMDVTETGAPDWEALKPHYYPPVQHGTFHKSTRVVPIITSRGCPHPCSFCAGSLMTGKKIRRRPVKDVIDEIEFLKRRYNFEEFIIEDENFTFYKERVLEFADEIRNRGIKCYFSLPNGVRLDKLDEEIIQKLRSMGTYMVALGIESISPNTLKRMKKDWTREQIIEKVALLKKYGFIVQASFILGFRDDTLDDVRQSVDFALGLNVDQAYFGNYMPLPGTEDFNLLLGRKEIALPDIDWSQYNAFYGRYPYHPAEISTERLEKEVKIATARFYLRPGILFKFLKRMSHPTFLKSLMFRISRVFFKRR